MTHHSLITSLTADDLATYERDGVVCLRGVLSPNEIEGLRDSVAAQMSYAGPRATSYDFEALAKQIFSGQGGLSAKAERFDLREVVEMIINDPDIRPIRDEVDDEEGGMFFYDAAGWRFYQGIRDAALDSALPSLCAQLLKTSKLHFWEDTTFVKAPQTAQRTTFHQDYGYFQIEGTQCCIVWIPLDSVDQQTGPMEYVRGSHLWNELYAPNILVSQTIYPNSPFGKTPDIEANRNDYDIISFDVEPGDVIIHDVRTVHGSAGNLSKDKMRRAVSLRYCGDDIRYNSRPGAVPQLYIQHEHRTGDALDPRDYPLVFPLDLNAKPSTSVHHIWDRDGAEVDACLARLPGAQSK